MIKQTLKDAIENDVGFRRGVPIDIWNRFGETYSGCDTDSRRAFMKDVILKMFRKLEDHVDVDAAVDKMAIKYQYDALPPVIISCCFFFNLFFRRIEF